MQNLTSTLSTIFDLKEQEFQKWHMTTAVILCYVTEKEIIMFFEKIVYTLKVIERE